MGNLDKQYWASRYVENKTGWQLQDAHPKLVEYMKLITGDETPKKFFLPLCGKSKDIPYLLSLGHSVFGIEYVAQAIEELSEENSLDLKLNQETSCYEAKDSKLIIYCGDYKSCPIENWGPFDVVWDRSSLIAIGYENGDREAYVEIIKRCVGFDSQKDVLLKLNPIDWQIKTHCPLYLAWSTCLFTFIDHKYCYLLQTIDYDKITFDGPPKSVSEEDVNKFFGSWCSMKLLEKKYIPEDSVYRTVSGNMTGDAYESYLLLTNKN